MKLEELKERMNQKFKEYGWWETLRMFLLSDEWDKILAYHAQILNDDKHFYPSFKYLLEPFKYIRPEDVKSILMDAEELSKNETAIVSNSITIQNIFKERYGDPEKYAKNNGVLYIRMHMTCTDIKGQYRIWEPFISYLLEQLNKPIYSLKKVLYEDS